MHRPPCEATETLIRNHTINKRNGCAKTQKKEQGEMEITEKGLLEHELWEKAPEVKLSVDQARMTRDQACHL